jgi:hypothetical protein
MANRASKELFHYTFFFCKLREVSWALWNMSIWFFCVKERKSGVINYCYLMCAFVLKHWIQANGWDRQVTVSNHKVFWHLNYDTFLPKLSHEHLS